MLFAAAAVIVLLKAWQGWRLGVVRQVIGLAAVAAATVCGYFGSGAMGTLLASMLPLPERLLGAAGGVLLGGLVYVAITILSAILFNKTSDQGLAIIRIGYGLLGAAIGAIYGLVIVGALALGLRVLGSIAETKLGIEKNAHLGGSKAARADPLARRLAAAKHAVEAGPGGAILRAVDPLPESTYSTLAKLAALAANSRNIERLADYPGIRPVMQHPKVAALIKDPELAKAITEHRYLALLSNPRLVAAADDPELSERLRAIDLEKALDYALRKPGPAK
jgi:hypothetical protein